MREQHGGDIYRHQVEVDFSVNINPLGIPKGVREQLYKSVDHCTWYPDPKTLQLREAIAGVEQCTAEEVLCGNGASELFMAIIHGLAARRIVIPVPSFLGYEKAALADGAQILYYPLREADGFRLTEDICESLTGEVDLLILANPNNPVGNVIAHTCMERILAHCQSRGIYVLLDECFLGFVEEAYVRQDWWRRYLCVLSVRAFTKLYAIPGVRLGYLLCADARLRKQIEAQLPEWNISVPAQEAGVAACREEEYRRQTPSYVKKEREFLKTELEKLGESGWIRIWDSQAPFLLVYTEYSLKEWLLQERLLIRDCSNFRGLGKGFYRIAVKNHGENERLLEAVRDCLKYNRGNVSIQ